MKFIDQKKTISSLATIQSCNSILDQPQEVQPSSLDFQEDHNKIFIFMNHMKAQKKKLKELTESQQQFLIKVIKALQTFLNQKKKVSLQLIYEGLVQVAIITSIYQGKVQMIYFSLECVKKIVNFIEELEEQEESTKIKMDVENSPTLTYKHKLGAILHMIIILICKTQKQKDIHYVKLLKKLFTPAVREKLVHIQLPKDQKVVKMYSVVLGYIGEKYSTQKLQKKISDRIVELFVLVQHDKTLFYLANYLRQKCTQNRINAEHMIRIGFLDKIKNMVKQHKEKPHISHLYDLYTRLMINSPKHVEHFYDQQIMFLLTESKEALQQRLPTLHLTPNYNRIVAKLFSHFVKLNKIQQNQEVKAWSHEKIIFHFESLSDKNDNQFSFKIISLLMGVIPHQTLLNLVQRNFISSIFDIATVSSDKIALIVMNIALKIAQNGSSLSHWLNKVLMQQILQNTKKIDVRTVHYLIVEQIGKIKSIKSDKMIEQEEQDYTVK